MTEHQRSKKICEAALFLKRASANLQEVAHHDERLHAAKGNSIRTRDKAGFLRLMQARSLDSTAKKLSTMELN